MRASRRRRSIFDSVDPNWRTRPHTAVERATHRAGCDVKGNAAPPVGPVARAGGRADGAESSDRCLAPNGARTHRTHPDPRTAGAEYSYSEWAGTIVRPMAGPPGTAEIRPDWRTATNSRIGK